MAQQMGQPVLILREGASRIRGRDAQNVNIAAAKAVARAVRTTLGPQGMDKMLVSSGGDITITNDGATILQEMDIEHPAAKMMVEVARTQDDEVGDGTTTAVVIAGELLDRAEDLIDQDVHPTVIAEGYREAVDKAMEYLKDCTINVSPDDKTILARIARSALTGKSAEAARDHLIDLVVRAVSMVAEENATLDPENVKVEKRVGGSIEDTRIVEGVVIDKERAHSQMPGKVMDARILLLDAPIEVRKTEMETEISITRPEQFQAFLDQEERMVHSMVEKIAESRATAVFCQKGIDDIAQHYLAKAGILAVRRVKKSDMERLMRATRANLLNSVDAITEEDLGYAGIVEEHEVAGEEMIFVEKCRNPKAVSLIVRGGTEHVVDEIERVLHDAIRVVTDVIEDGKIVPGGGAPETEIATRLRDFAPRIGGRMQLAMYAFADSLEVIPRTLAENAGLDPIGMLTELRLAHEKGEKTAGLDVYRGRPDDMVREGVVDPLRVKIQAITSAAEAAIQILRIDDVIASSKTAAPPEGGMPPGGMGGMGEMYGGMGEY